MKTGLFSLAILAFILVSTGSADLKCRLTETVESGKKIDPNREMCAYQPFQGPVGQIIAGFKPTKISKAVTDHGNFMVTTMASFIGLAPVVGGIVSTALTQFATFYFESQTTVINRLISEVESQIQTLKTYVDAKVQEHEFKQLSQHLRGLLSAAKTCADYDKKDQLARLEGCLISLNTKTISLVGRFMPNDNSIIAYDWLLPLFRQYADLQLTISQDLLRVAMILKRTSAIGDYVKRLRDQSNMFFDYSKDSIDKLIKVHTSYGSRTCSTGIKWWNPSNPFSTQRGHYGKCTQTLFRGRKCADEIVIPLSKSSNGVDGRNKAWSAVVKCMTDYHDHVKRNVEKDLRKYWQFELLDVAQSWLKISTEAEKLAGKLKISG